MNDSSTEDGPERDGNRVIFVDGAGVDDEQRYDEEIVDAVRIIRDAGYVEDPNEYILEALRGQSGSVVEEFDPQGEAGPTEVDLTDQHRRHFQVRTRGEVFI